MSNTNEAKRNTAGLSMDEAIGEAVGVAMEVEGCPRGVGVMTSEAAYDAAGKVLDWVLDDNQERFVSPLAYMNAINVLRDVMTATCSAMSGGE